MLAADIDAQLGLATCLWDRVGQMTRRSLPERSYTGVQSDSSEAVGGVSGAAGDKKIGGNGVEGTFSNDMTCGEMTFGHTQTNRQALEPNV